MTAQRKILMTATAVILLILLMSTFLGKKGLLEIRQTRNRQAVLLTKIEGLKKEKVRLEKEVEELRRNPHMVEEEARKKLWLIKPEEKVLILPRTKDKKEK